MSWTADGVVAAPATVTDAVAGHQTLGAFKYGNATSKPLAQLSGGDYVFAWYDQGEDGLVAQRVNSSGATQWGADGVVFYAAGGNSAYIEAIVPDASGNVIIVYQINGSESIYAQKLDSSGAVQWAAGGLPVADVAATLEATPVAVSDGQGGVIVAYRRGASGSYNIYAQRLNASGAKQWVGTGTIISSAANNQFNPVIVTSGTSSAIIAWTDLRGGSNNDIYTQKISSAGTVQWTANGVAVSSASGNQSNMVSAVADGSDGAVFTWTDDRSGAQGVYAQKMDTSGVAQWTANGTAIFTGTSGSQADPRVTMSSTNAMIVYTRMDTDEDLYIQKLNASGTKMFGDGVKIANSADAEHATNIMEAGDGSTDVIVTWTDDNVVGNVYAQRIDTGGDVEWTAGGVTALANGAVNVNNPATNPYGITNSAGDLVMVGDRTSLSSTGDVFTQRIQASDGAPQWNGTAGLFLPNGIGGTADQQNPHVATDGAGNYFYAWTDYRTSAMGADIYAQKMNASGVPQWTSSGIAVATGSTNQIDARVVSDDSGGVIILWIDVGADTIVAQRLDANGSVHAGWAAGGVTLASGNSPFFENITTDGSGGIFVDFQGDNNTTIRVNRVTDAGALPWGLNGVSASDPANLCGSFQESSIAIDDAGGVYVAWNNSDAGTCLTDTLYLTRLDSDGNVHTGWTTYGDAMTSDTTANGVALDRDGSGGVLAAWEVDLGGGNNDIQAQRFNGSGAEQWTTDGVDVVTEAASQSQPMIVKTGAGESLIAWIDTRAGASDIYIQKLDGSGVAQWTANGVGNGSATVAGTGVNLFADELGGAVLVWEDVRTDSDIYGQSFDTAGTVKWTVGGLPIAAVASNYEQLSTGGPADRQVSVSDGYGGVVVVYEFGTDLSFINPSEVRTQRVIDSDGFPAVTVTDPDGGESLTGGASMDITWTNSGIIDHFKISLSTDSGATFPTVITASDSASPFSWTIDNITTTTARIKVEAQDASNVTQDEDVSDANFSITAVGGGGGGGGNPSPAITLGSPNGGETITPGSSFNVTWTAQGSQISNVRLTLSSDGGATYPTVVASGLASSSGFYTWNVPANQPASTTARMKVEGLGGGTVLVTDVSNANFTISAPAGTPPPETPPPTEPPPTEPPPEPTGPVVHVDVRIGVNETTLEFEPATVDPKPGDVVTYVITVVNSGDAPAQNVTIVDQLPSGTAYDSPSLTIGDTLLSDANDGDGATFDAVNRLATFVLGTLPAGTSMHASFRVKVLPGATTLDNIMTVTGDGISTMTDQTQTSVAPASTEPSEPPPEPPATEPPASEPPAPTIPPGETPTEPTSEQPPVGEPEPQPAPETGGGGTIEPPPTGGGTSPGTSGGEGTGTGVSSETSVFQDITSFVSEVGEQVATFLNDVAGFFYRSDATIAETPVLDAAVSVVKDIPIIAPAVEAVRDATVAVRESPAAQTTNNYVVTPATFVIVAGVTASGIGGIAGMFPYFLFLLTQPIALLRKRKLKEYGTAYNFATKLPVDLAIVRLTDAATGRAAGSRVTDREGRYLMIAPPGRFKLDARKEGYAFPPALPAAPEADGRFADLSFGQEFSLPQGGVIAKNVPLDPFEDRRPDRVVLRDAVRSRVQWAIVAVGPGAAVMSYAATPKLIQFLALTAQIGLYFLFRRLARPKRPKNWGVVRGADGKPLRQAIVRIHETQYNKVLESQVTDAKGRYTFLVGPGRFYLTVEKQGHTPIKTDILDFTAKPDASVAAVDVSMRAAAPAISSPT